MRKTIVAFAIAVLLISSFPTIVFAAPQDNPSPVSDFSSQQILVKFKPGTSQPEVTQIHRQLGGKVKETIPGIGVQVVTVSRGQAKEKAKAYSANARVAYAEPDSVVQALGNPNDLFFANQWGLNRVGAPQAWDVTAGSSQVSIAILDTGVDLDHPDLVNKIISNTNFSGSNTTDDIYGHGTHVAGIAAAATNNGIGVAGLGYASSIINVKVLGDDGFGYSSWIAQGIVWAADNGANIINLSLGDSSASSAVEDAVNYAWNKGVVVVAAAGNNGNTSPFYPAYYINCIATANTNVNDARSLFSNYGDWVDVAAPGDNIFSTWKGNRYGSMSGTSMASPHVAGLAALLFTVVSDTNGDGKLNDEVRSRIEATCDDIGVAGIGHGRINAARAVGDVAPVPAGRIAGQVTDAKDGSPVVGAAVTDGTRTALTDAAGLYSIDDVAPGTYNVAANKEGYQTASLTIAVLSGSTSVANLSLNEVIVPGSIIGLVTDVADGSVVVGATVSDGTKMTTTDAMGTYIIGNVTPGTYQVTAGKAGYQSSSLTVTVLAGSATAANLSLSEIILLGTIGGTVTSNNDGLPMAGATVTDGTRTTTTDAIGTYTIANVPPGTYQVTASKSGYYSASLTVTVVAEGNAVANLSLNEIPGTITGTVTRAKDGSAIAGATVTDGARTATADATGRYTITKVPAGVYQVTASKSGYYSASLTVTVVSGGNAVANLSLSEIPGTITGTVTDAASGSPIAGATVTDGARTTTTDAAGKYTITNLPPGAYQVTASKSGYYSSSLTATVLPGTATVANFSLSQIPGSISGSVTDAKDGSPLVGATVTDGTRTAVTDATGQYSMNDVPPGSYQVVANKEGYESSSLNVTVLAGSTVLANLSLNEIVVFGSISGSVTDAKDGSPIVGATVSDGVRTALTDTGGQYIIGGVPEGSYTVIASAAGYSASSQAMSVVAAQTATVDLALTELAPPPPEPLWVQSIVFSVIGKNLRLNINVVSVSGAVTGAQVIVQLTNGVQNWNFTGTTDSSGNASFVVTRAPTGSYVASVTAITLAGYTWDTTQGVTSASYTLKRGGGKR